MSDSFDRLKAALAEQYAIEREIGAGGMATVYLAEDLRHRRKVAVKVLRTDLAAALGSDRFIREIEVAAQLHHPHILPLYDSGASGEFLYYVMPYEQGQSLRERLDTEGELPIAEAARVLRDIVDALAHAHAQGVVHRDIKPDNVMMSGRHAVVTDFGVAKAVSDATGRHQLTTAGIALGTPAYMAPEQASADPNIDHRADIYAVGVLAYELLTGTPPFVGSSPQTVLAAHVTENPRPITDHRTSVPPGLASIIMRCLEKKPADRPQSAEELVPAFEALTTPSGGLTPTAMTPAPVARSARWWVPVALVGVAALVIGAIVVGSRSAGDTATAMPDADSRIAVLRFEQAGVSGDDEYFGDGIAQDINIQLQKVGGFTVIAHGSSRQYRSADGGYADIAGALDAQYIIDGSIRRASDLVRISVSLIEPATSAQLWADDFTVNLSVSDIFEVQSAIARDVAETLGATFGGDDAATPTANLEAYDAYLLGRFHWAKRDPEGIAQAIEHFSNAVAIDSGYALAWAGLADAYGFVPWYALGIMEDAPERAIAAAERAVALDSTLAEAWASLAILRWLFQWEWDEAEDLFSRSLELNDQYAAAQAWFGSYLVATGRIDEGTALSERAIRLDPLMANWHLNLAQAHLVAGRDAEAVEPLQRWEELQARPNPFLGEVFDRLGRADDAARQIEALHQRGDTTVAGLLYLGATGAVDAFLAGRERAFEAGEFSPMALAEAYIVAERVDDALRMLEHAVALRDPRLAWITFRLPGILEFMRDPRAMEILRETGVAQFF